MEIKTTSIIVRGSKRNLYMKWLQGWVDGHGWTGHTTLDAAWERAENQGKPKGCSWYAYGLLMAREQGFGRKLQSDSLSRELGII
jgi:hypothetical protein